MNNNCLFCNRKEIYIVMGKTKNTFIAFWYLLRTKHSQSFSNVCYNEAFTHEHMNKLFGSFLDKMFFLPFFLLYKTLPCLFFCALIKIFTFVRLFNKHEPGLTIATRHYRLLKPQYFIRAVIQSHSDSLT